MIKWKRAVIVLSVFIFAMPMYAETTKEMINRLAEANRKNNKWVSPSDCPAEQQAVRSISNCTDLTGNDTEQSITFALAYPWVYRFSGKVTGELMTSEELRQEAKMRLNSINDSSNVDQCRVAITRLTACAYEVAARKNDGEVTITKEAEKVKIQSQCPSNSIEKINGAINQIDQRINDYLESLGGSQSTNATPMLQVVMWGTSEQSKIMKQYCPEAFKQEIDDRMESYESALRACRQIQSNPEICGPVKPN